MSNIVFSDILVFKTSIYTQRDIEKIAGVLDQNPYIRRWNVDHEDVDHILRIETTFYNPAKIIELISRAGFFCEELPD